MTSLARHVMCRSLTSVTASAPQSHHTRSSWQHHPRAPSRPTTPMPMPQSAPRPFGKRTVRSSPRKLSNTQIHRTEDILGSSWPQEHLARNQLGRSRVEWSDRLTGGAVTDVPDPVMDTIEETAIDTMKRAEQYLSHLQRSMDNEPRENDCTFCGAWFPAYWLLGITPQGAADWRNNYYRCCFQCVSGRGQR